MHSAKLNLTFQISLLITAARNDIPKMADDGNLRLPDASSGVWKSDSFVHHLCCGVQFWKAANRETKANKFWHFHNKTTSIKDPKQG